MQPIDVMTVGLEPLHLDGHGGPPPSELPSDPARGEMPGLVQRLGNGEGLLLVVVPTWAREPARRRLDVVRSALAVRRQVVRFPTELPPLGAAVLAALGASLAPSAPAPGVLVDALRVLESELVLVAALPSVRRLRRPRPTLGQRARSLLPGGRFLVRAQPDPLVVAVRRDGDAPDLLGEVDRNTTGLVVADRGRVGSWEEEALGHALPGASVLRLAGQGDESRRWGVAQPLEAVAYSTDRRALVDDLLTVAGYPCPWCGEAVTTLPCPLCGHDRNRELQEAVS